VAAPAAAVKKRRPPPPPSRLFLCFTDVTKADIAQLNAAATKGEIKQILKRCLGMDQPPGFLTEILADMHLYNFSFARSKRFPPAKTSTFLSIMKLVLEEGVRKRLPANEAFDVLKAWLLKHSVERPPMSVGIFDFDDVKDVTEYVHNTFFRHYRLYIYAFRAQNHFDIFLDEPDRGPPVLAMPAPLPVSAPLVAADEVEANAQPELAHRFGPTEEELAEAERLRAQQAGSALEQSQGETKDDIIRRKVEEGMVKLLQKFDERLKDQDTRFQAVLEGT